MLNWFKKILLQVSTHQSRQTPLASKQADIDTLVRQGFELHESGADVKAAVIFKQILQIDPFHADALYLLGTIAQKNGDYASAIKLVEKAIVSRKNEPFFYMTLGDIHLAKWDLTHAASCYESALEIAPDSISTMLALGSTYEHSRQTNAAERCFKKLLDLQPDCAPALNKLAEVYLDCGKPNQAIPLFKQAHLAAPNDFTLYSAYLFSTNYSLLISPDEVLREHLKFDELYGDPQSIKKTKVLDTRPDRKLRLAYISPDFRLHAVSKFFEPVLMHHDKSQFEIICYHLYQSKDQVSERLQKNSDDWVECSGLSDESLYNKIKHDDIDILVDLTGHTSNNRLLVLAKKPAPIQITWLGYINTTGLKAMDYRIVDHNSDPIGLTDAYHSERLLRLPNSQWCYSSPESTTELSSLPGLTSGRVTFGSFNRFSKVSEKILLIWAKMLALIPRARLIIIDVPEDEQETLLMFFKHLRVDNDSISLYGRLQHKDFVALHNIVDIGLDAYPYSGATTTCDSLWLGVPTLTLAGKVSISRSTASIMKTIELSDWVAETEEEFLEIAIKQSSDLNSLALLRSGIRERMQASPLMDAPLFTKNLERAYRQVWIEKCKEQQTDAEKSMQ